MKKGGLKGLLTIIAIAGGGYVIYKTFFEKRALADHVGDNALPTVVYQGQKEYWYGQPTQGYANRVYLNPDGTRQFVGPPAPGEHAGQVPFWVTGMPPR